MSNYFCPNCGVDCEEPICKYCNGPAESLDVDFAEKTTGEKYSPEEMDSVEDLANREDDLDSGSDDNI